MQSCVLCKQFISDDDEKDCVVALGDIPMSLCSNCRKQFANLQLSKIITERREGIVWAKGVIESGILPESMNRELLGLCDDAEIYIKRLTYGHVKPDEPEEDYYDDAKDTIEDLEYAATLDTDNHIKTVKNRGARLKKLIITSVVAVVAVLTVMGFAFKNYLTDDAPAVVPQLVVMNDCTTTFGTPEAMEECKQVLNNYYQCFTLRDYSTASDYILFTGARATVQKVDWKYSMKKQYSQNVDFTKPVKFTVEDASEDSEYKYYKFSVVTNFSSLADGTRIRTTTNVYGFVYQGHWYIAPNISRLNGYINARCIESK